MDLAEVTNRLTNSRWTMKRASIAVFGLCVVLSGAGRAAPTVDPLTGLPLYPGAGSGPIHMPDAHICKSAMKGNFYVVNGAKVDVTVAWYATHLQGFHKRHSYVDGRTQDTFFSADGTLEVTVTGSPGGPSDNADAYGISYGRFEPGLKEKGMASFNQPKMVCD
jgi:hypothetical protein